MSKVFFTKISKETNWVMGEHEGGYSFDALLFDLSSEYGINEGRVSKLMIKKTGTEGWDPRYAVVNYDRGWDVRPKTPEVRKVYKEILAFLESAPDKMQLRKEQG